MIVEGLVGLAMNFLEMIFSGFNLVTIPVDISSTLLTVLGYGAWIMGADMVALVFTTILGWLMFRFVAGVLIFVWRLLPLT